MFKLAIKDQRGDVRRGVKLEKRNSGEGWGPYKFQLKPTLPPDCVNKSHIGHLG